MRTLSLIAVLIFCTAFRSFAQDPVPLEVWATVKGSLDAFEFPLGISGGMSYIPNFKKGAIPHAFIVNYRPFDATFEQRDGKVFTWGFSHPTDTINRYTWGGKNFIPIFTPDINGDGYRDFMNKDGIIYVGTDRDEPDTNKAHTYPANAKGFAKLNDDNCDDLYYYGMSPHLIHFRFGNPAAGKFQSVSIKSTHTDKDPLLKEFIRGFYKNKQGKWRMVTHSEGQEKGMYEDIWMPEKSFIRLYDIQFKQVNNDSTEVITTQIDEYHNPEWLQYKPDMNSKDPLFWIPLNAASLLYTSEHFPKIFYYASFNTLPDKETQKFNSYATIIDLTDDKIKPTNNNITPIVTGCTILKHSIDGDNVEDLAAQLGDQNVHFYRVLSNGQIKESMLLNCDEILKDGYLSHLQSIDDISSDGIPDITCLLTNKKIGHSIIIANGKTVINSLIETQEIDFSIQNPYPVPNLSQMVIPLYCTKTGLYSLSLHNLQGKDYPLFSHKQLSIGNTQHLISTADFSSGTYIIRFTDGERIVEKSILIQH